MAHASSRKTHEADALPARAHPELFQDLLVYQDESDASANALAYATVLADEADGNLSAIMLSMINIYPMGLGDATADVWLAAQRQAEKEAKEMEQRLRERLAKSSPRAELRRSDIVGGDSAERLAEYGRYADATVLGWSGKGKSENQRSLFNAALFHSGRPVMVVPEEFKRHQAPRNIMIAWSPSKEAARAVHDGLPLLKAADAVQITVVDDFATQIEKENAGVDIAKHLARHDVHAEVKHVPKGSYGATRTLLDEAQYFAADLVVLGGYGHSRLSEWMLGGVTREMLADCKVPMLFSH